MFPIAVETLANGLTAVAIERPAAHQVLVVLMVRTGSRFEQPAQAGISHFLEHMLFRGNGLHATSREMSLAFEQTGGMLNATTGVESTEFYFVCHPDRLEQALEQLAAFIQGPTFPDLEKERQIIQDEILYDYNDHGALVDLPTLAAQLLWPDHPLSQPITGTPPTLASLTREALQRYHVQAYTPDSIVLALAGKLRPEHALEAVRRRFGGWQGHRGGPRANPVPAPAIGWGVGPPLASAGPTVKLVTDADNQFHLQLSFPGPGYNAEEELALSLLSRVLDDGPCSVLQRVVREERALVYGISAGYTGYVDAGQFDVSTSVTAEHLPDVLACVLQILREMREAGPTPQDVELARQRHRFDLEFGQDALSAWTDRYAWPLLYSQVRGVEEELALIEGITAVRLRELAARLFAKERLHLVLVGPVEAKTEQVLWQALSRA